MTYKQILPSDSCEFGKRPDFESDEDDAYFYEKIFCIGMVF